MADERVNFVLGARDNATATVKRVRGELAAVGGVAGKAAGPLDKLALATGGLVSPATLAVGAGAALVAGMSNAANAAGDQEEALNKLRVVFDSSSAGLERFADTSARSLGMSKTAALGALGTFGNLFVAMGTGQKPAADMSSSLVQLAADLASFNNLDPTEVLDKLRAGIVGEAEPLRTLGVNITAARTEQYALTAGIWDGVGALTAAQKATANYHLIMADTKTAQGDFARTSDGLANSQRSLGAAVEDMTAKIGQAALPALTGFTNFMLDTGVPAIELFVDAMGSIGEAAEGVARGLDFISGASDDVTRVQQNLGISYMEARDLIKAATADRVINAEEAANRIIAAAVDEGTALGGLAIDTAAAWEASQAATTTGVGATRARLAESGADWQAYTESISTSLAVAAEQVNGPAEYIAALQGVKIREHWQEVRDSAYQTAVQYAAGLMDAQNEPKVAMDAQMLVLRTALTEQEERSRLSGYANSSQIARGMDDARPEVRAATEAAVLAIEERLRTLDGSSYGRNLGNTLASGIWSSVGNVSLASRALSGAAAGPIMIESEPRDPRSKLRGITRWGGNIGDTLAEGMIASLGGVDAAAGLMAAAAVPPFGSTRTAYATAASGSPFGSGSAGGGVTVNFQSPLPVTPSQATEVARLIIPELRRELSRQGF